MIIKKRMTASIEGDFVVLLIGMRINQVWKIHRWLPVAKAMGRMLRELHAQPELGFLHHEMSFARTTIMVQYWRSMDHLLAYAKNKDTEHLPAWREFNRSVGTDGSVGIWHESYEVKSGAYESVYSNMPAFGLGKAGSLESISGERESAAGRLGRN